MHRTTTIALLALAALSTPAAAFHRQTPPIVSITTGGDTAFPRIPSGGVRLVFALDVSGHPQVILDDRHRSGFELQQLTSAGNNENPTIAWIDGAVAWDSDCTMVPGCTDPGRQIFEWVNHEVMQVTHDMSGTSVNPSLSGQGNALAWESTGDLVTGTMNAGVRQIFLRTADGLMTQVSHGMGTSRNAALDRSARNLVYESSNDLGGHETNIPQIWLLQTTNGSHAPLTNGAGPSRRPAISTNGRVIVFESTSALTAPGAPDTHVSQIFAYNARTGALTQITNATDANDGCTGASVSQIPGDWRIGYVCHGEGYFHTLFGGRTFKLPVPGTDTQQAIAELGTHFMTVSTKADLMNPMGGSTPGHQLYLLNLFKLVATPVN